MLLINKPLPLAVAFKIPVPEALTTLKAFPYCKNELAEKKDSKVVDADFEDVTEKKDPKDDNKEKSA